MSKLPENLNIRLFSLLASGLIRLLGFTARLRVVGYDQVRELVRSRRGFILALWHGRTLMPVYYCRGMGIWAITSLSRDGEMQTQTIERLGYKSIRGSTGRGGIRAALTAAKKLQEGGILAITPDGPKGPPNEVQEGIVFLAQLAGCPIIPIGVGMRPRKLMQAWDSYALPMPFAKCALVFGEPIYVREDESGYSSPAEDIKIALDEIQRRAQRMVREGG